MRIQMKQLMRIRLCSMVFLWSHVGWFLSHANFHTQFERVKELAKFPELRFLDRFDVVVPTIFAVGIFFLVNY